jgi:2-phospho-L-lactate guanylyltransferase
MTVWALVPAKDFGRGKSRLRPALSDDARAAFARSLFDHVVGVLTASQVVGGVLVATDSPLVAAAARAHRAEVLLDPPGVATLAAVVDGGLAELAARGARAALVLMADLPHLGPDDVRALVALLDDHEVAIVRADDGQHTNALALAPPTCLATAFGRPDSFAAHVAAAHAAGLRVAIIESAGVAFDVDGPDELARLVATKTRG